MPEGRLQAIFYNNPDGYPPIVNSARPLAAEGYSLDILCREYGPRWEISYPAGVTLHRIAPPSTSSLVAYFHFIWQAWRQAQAPPAAAPPPATRPRPRPGRPRRHPRPNP